MCMYFIVMIVCNILQKTKLPLHTYITRELTMLTTSFNPELFIVKNGIFINTHFNYKLKLGRSDKTICCNLHIIIGHFRECVLFSIFQQ